MSLLFSEVFSLHLAMTFVSVSIHSLFIFKDLQKEVDSQRTTISVMQDNGRWLVHNMYTVDPRYVFFSPFCTKLPMRLISFIGISFCLKFISN